MAAAPQPDLAAQQPGPGSSSKSEKPQDRDHLFTWKHMFPIIVSVLALSISVRQSFIANEAATVAAYDRGVSPVLELDKAYLANSDIRAFFLRQQTS